MIAFEVRVNKVKVCTAGMGEMDAIIGGLTSTIDKDGRPDQPKIRFHMSGVADKEPFIWIRQSLAVGDRVEIRVIDTERSAKEDRVQRRLLWGLTSALQATGCSRS